MLVFRQSLIDYLIKLATDNFINNLEQIDNGEFTSELVEFHDQNLIIEALTDFTEKCIISQSSVAKVEITGNSVIRGLLEILTKYAFHNDEKYRKKIKGMISNSRLQVTMHEHTMQKKGKDQYKIYTIDELFNFDIADLEPYSRLRVIVDFVSSMTDKYAIETFQKLSGYKI